MPPATRNLRFFICFALGILACLLTGANTHADWQGNSGPVPGRYIIKLKPGVQPSQLRAALSGDEALAPLVNLPNSSLPGVDELTRYYIFEDQTKSASLTDLQTRFNKDLVETVEQDFYLEFFDFPNDSLFDWQWYLHNTGQSYPGVDRYDGIKNDSLVFKQGEIGVDVGLTPLYQTPPAEATRVVVAVIDTGVDPTHPEMEGQFWRNEDEIPGNHIDDDHNGFVDDTIGYDISGDFPTLFTPTGDNNITDTIGHGTHIAGIIAARQDGKGVVGIAPNVAIMPVKIYPNAFGSIGTAAIIYAVVNGANVISISWGSQFVSTAMRDALLFARANNVFVAIAAGNSGSNDRFYPAAYDSSFVVGASNSDGEVTGFSTYGNHIDIVAPGADILSLRAARTDLYAAGGEPNVHIIDSLYYLSDGTSMATPMVSAAAARLFAIRPNLSVPQLEQILEASATDLIDPYNVGDTLPGKDSISGYGMLDIGQAVAIGTAPGLVLTAPKRSVRYTGDITVKATSFQGYTGGWQLYRSMLRSSDPPALVASGGSIPVDSILYVQTGTEPQGVLEFTLVDDIGREFSVSCTYVTARNVMISSPLQSDTEQYQVPIRGSAYGPDFDSVLISRQKTGQGKIRLFGTTAECFDSLLYNWTISGSDTGDFAIYVNGFFGTEQVADTVNITITSAFAFGWPKSLNGKRGSISPVVADLDNDGVKEVILGTQAGLYVWSVTDIAVYLLPGFPILPDEDCRTMPAIYDLDKDGWKDIVFTTANKLNAYSLNGLPVAGFPAEATTGSIPYGFGYPVTTITQLNPGDDSAIVFINLYGDVMAYRFDGSPYFYSLQGLYASLYPRLSDYAAAGGFTWPQVGAADLDGDGLPELAASYMSSDPYTGISILEGRTGRPAWQRNDATILHAPSIDGMLLADLNGDSLPEVVAAGRDSLLIPTVWIKTNGQNDLPGWPIRLPSVTEWAGTYPAIADLDMDGSPEIILTYFNFDVGAIYAYRADGTPYINKPDHPPGELFYIDATLGTPVIADVVGDQHPEVLVRSGYVLPGTGYEQLHIIDYQGNEPDGYPIVTPTSKNSVYATQFAPLVDDLDGDGLVEVALVGDENQLFVWNFPASSRGGTNIGKLFFDNLNANIYHGSSMARGGSR